MSWNLLIIEPLEYVIKNSTPYNRRKRNDFISRPEGLDEHIAYRSWFDFQNHPILYSVHIREAVWRTAARGFRIDAIELLNGIEKHLDKSNEKTIDRYMKESQERTDEELKELAYLHKCIYQDKRELLSSSSKEETDAPLEKFNKLVERFNKLMHP